MHAGAKSQQRGQPAGRPDCASGAPPADGHPESVLQRDRHRAFLEFLPEPVIVVNMDKTVTYLNPAFAKVFGWTLEELEGRLFPFVPPHLKQQTREVVQRLFREEVVYGFETQRMTKGGRVLDVIIDGAVFYHENGQQAGQIVTFRDVTREKRMDRTNQALFRVAKALYQFRGLDERLDVITREVQDLMAVEGAIVILIDDENREFFFRAAAYNDTEAGKNYKETRYPLDQGVSGQVVRTGEPMIVSDYYNSPFFVERVDRQTGFTTRNMLQVPMRTEKRMIGTLCVVNKHDGRFEPTDVDLLSAIASMVALPIVNATINEKLEHSYQEVQSLSRAKDRVIHHLSHELKTPVSVLDASLSLLSKRIKGGPEDSSHRVLDRARRNLQRILEMQYQIEDILRERDYTRLHLLTAMLEACEDELEALLADENVPDDILDRVRLRIQNVFGPKDAVSEDIRLDRFAKDRVQALRPRFAHRGCRLITQIVKVPPVHIPKDVLGKILDGLIRNAVENTPDGGRIVVAVGAERGCPELTVSDFGVGITSEHKQLIFENYFTAYETLQYTSKQPFDFGAGGKGFDLLRIKIFSERYNFNLQMRTRRCRHIPGGDDRCPGDIQNCVHCRSDLDCIDTGGTMVRISFPSGETQGAGPGRAEACVAGTEGDNVRS